MKLRKWIVGLALTGVLASPTLLAKPPKIKPPSTLIQKTGGPKPEKLPELMLKKRGKEDEERVERFVGEFVTKDELNYSIKQWSINGRVVPNPLWLESLAYELRDTLEAQGIEKGSRQWIRAVDSFKDILTLQEFENFKVYAKIGPPPVIPKEVIDAIFLPNN